MAPKEPPSTSPAKRPINNHKRSQYRSSPDSWQGLVVAVIHAKVRYPAGLIDASGGGMCLAFDEDAAPELGLGTAVTVSMQTDLMDDAIEAVAMVAHSEPQDGRRIMGLRFLDWMGLVAMVPKSLASLFNLRADARLFANPAKPWPVAIRDADGKFDLTGMIDDISCSGLSFRTELLSQCILNRVDEIVLEFQLPSLAHRFSFVGIIRYRCLAGEALRFGVWFDAEATYTCEAQQAALSAYVEKRQKAKLDEVFKF